MSLLVIHYDRMIQDMDISMIRNIQIPYMFQVPKNSIFFLLCYFRTDLMIFDYILETHNLSDGGLVRIVDWTSLFNLLDILMTLIITLIISIMSFVIPGTPNNPSTLHYTKFIRNALCPWFTWSY